MAAAAGLPQLLALLAVRALVLVLPPPDQPGQRLRQVLLQLGRLLAALRSLPALPTAAEEAEPPAAVLKVAPCRAAAGACRAPVWRPLHAAREQKPQAPAALLPPLAAPSGRPVACLHCTGVVSMEFS